VYDRLSLTSAPPAGDELHTSAVFLLGIDHTLEYKARSAQSRGGHSGQAKKSSALAGYCDKLKSSLHFLYHVRRFVSLHAHIRYNERSSYSLPACNIRSRPQRYQAPSFLTCLAYVTVMLATRIQNSTILNSELNIRFIYYG